MKKDERLRLTFNEQCLIVLMYIESGFTQKKIVAIFGYKEESIISKVCNLWVPLWGQVGEFLSLLPFIDAELIDKLETEKFAKLQLKKAAYLVDGKDFMSVTSRKDRVINCAQQSSKVHHSAVRIITWGLACGLSFEHTKGFLSRATEKNLIQLWAKFGCLVLPPGYIGVGDKVFFGTAGLYCNCNVVVCPAFLWKGIQFDMNQIGHSLQAAQGQYSIETYYSRVADRGCFQGKVLALETTSTTSEATDWTGTFGTMNAASMASFFFSALTIHIDASIPMIGSTVSGNDCRILASVFICLLYDSSRNDDASLTPMFYYFHG